MEEDWKRPKKIDKCKSTTFQWTWSRRSTWTVLIFDFQFIFSIIVSFLLLFFRMGAFDRCAYCFSFLQFQSIRLLTLSFLIFIFEFQFIGLSHYYSYLNYILSLKCSLEQNNLTKQKEIDSNVFNEREKGGLKSKKKKRERKQKNNEIIQFNTCPSKRTY